MAIKACSKCGINPVTTQRYCTPCKTAYNREWRKKNAEKTRIKREKLKRLLSGLGKTHNEIMQLTP